MSEDFNMIDKLQGLADEQDKQKNKEAVNEKEESEEEEVNEDGEIVMCDGGIKKKILRKGEGERPPKGSKVKVHYTGTLEDGTKFDSSRDRNDPFEFELGAGSVIKAWDEGVATMKVGERAIFTCREDYAYGKRGSPPKIPGGATLIFDIDCLSFGESAKDITDDGGVMKKVIRKGEGYQSPNETGVCQVKYTGTANNKVFTTHGDEKIVELNIDEDLKMPDGLSRALQSMNKGEKSSFTVRNDYGYGTAGNDELGISPGTDLVYTIEMVSFENAKGNWDMDTKEKIASMIKNKSKGNTFYGMRKYAKGCEFYTKAIDVFPEHAMKKLTDEEKKEITAVQVACHSNTAVCKLKLKEFEECIEACNKALEIDEAHVKSLFRRGQAHAYNGDNDKAMVDLKAAKKLKPDDKGIVKMCAAVRRRVLAQKKKERATFKGMFEKCTLAKGSTGGYPEKVVSDGGGSSSSDDSGTSSDSSDSDAEGTKEDKKESEAPKEDKKESEAPKEDKKESEAPKEDKKESEAPKEDKKESEAPKEDKKESEVPKEDKKESEAPKEDKESEAPKEDKKESEAPKGKKKVVKKKIIKKKGKAKGKGKKKGGKKVVKKNKPNQGKKVKKKVKKKVVAKD